MVNFLKSYAILLFISIALFSSCKKDPIYSESTSIKAGVTNNQFHHHLFDDNYLIDIEDKGCGTSRGFEALDLNMDGRTDIIISELVFDLGEYNNNYSTCCPPPMECFPSLSYSQIFSPDTSNFKILSINIDESTFFQQYQFADTLNFNSTIDTFKSWQERAYIIDKSNYSENPWLNITEDKYLGLRSYIDSTHKYGWIKIGIENERVVLKEMAFQK